MDFCHHCRLPIPPQDLVLEIIEGEEFRFCCNGCRGAYLIITGAGLGSFYQKRVWSEPGLPEGVFATAFDEGYLSRFTTGQDGIGEMTFLIEGIRCASCVWLIEKLLHDTAGVVDARMNFGTHRARIRFDPSRVTPAALVGILSRIGYLPRPFTQDAAQQAADRQRRSLLIRFGTAAFLSMQLMGYSTALYAGYFQGMEEQTRQLMHYFSAAVTTPVVFYAGSPFLHGAWRSLKNSTPNMDLLIAIGVLAAYGTSLYATFTEGEVYFDTAAMIVTLILAGRIFENSARRHASAGVDRLLRLAPDIARRQEGDDFIEVETAAVQVGDVLLVRPGERFPVDGMLLGGTTEVDESAATGEPLPAIRGPGEMITAGTLNLISAVTLRVTAGAADSFVARIARLVEEAQGRRAPIQRLADRVSGFFVPIVILVAAATCLFWTFFGEGQVQPVLAAVAVLVIACPCALGLATPTAVLVATGAGAARGILFRGGDVLEKAARTTLAAFDKTGTLTHGRPRVTGIRPATGTADDLLRLAALAEAGSSHPLAAGITEVARQAGVVARQADGVTTVPGRGVFLHQPDGLLRVGNRAFLQEAGIILPTAIEEHGLTEVHVAMAGEYRGVILLEDTPRQSAAPVLLQLRRLGLRTALLTGDRTIAGWRLADEVPLDEVLGDLTPQQKADWVEEAGRRGERVLMVGDGINDAPALSAAAVGCTMAGGTDIALEVSDLVLTRPDLQRLCQALSLARRTLRIIHQNLFWAFAYNLAALPLAAAGKLAPIHAAAAMALSSICVVGNSLRLSRTKENPDASIHTHPHHSVPVHRHGSLAHLHLGGKKRGV